MATTENTLTVNEARLDSEKDFDAVAFAKEIMSSVGADFHEDDPVFQTNEFRMHCYKILPCTKHFCHDWSVCPFAHFSERAKRRDPKDVKYTAIACPDMKKGETCPRGDRCPYSHNTFEYWLHPTRYRTRLCRDGEECNRKICFFAHKPEKVRVPCSRPSLPVAEDTWKNEELQVKCNEKEDSLKVEALAANNALDQQLQAILQTANLNINGTGGVHQTPATEKATFVDQVLNSLLPVNSNCSIPTELSFSNIQIPQQQQQQFAQSLCYDSCSPALGFSPVATTTTANLFDSVSNCQSMTGSLHQSINPVHGLNLSQFPMSGPLSGSGLLQGQSPVHYTPPIGISPCDLTTPQSVNNTQHYTGGAPLKTVDQYTEMLRMLSGIQMTNSPTSVLTNNVMGLGNYHSLSIDGSGSSISGNSGIGITDQEVEQAQISSISNSLMTARSPGLSYYGMTTI